MGSCMFSKRHYIAIAQVLTVTKAAASFEFKTEEEKQVAIRVLQILESSLIKMFKEDNERFDYYKFKRASEWEI